MANDEVCVLGVFSQKNGGALGRVQEAGSVEAVAARGVFFIPFAGNSVLESFFGHRLVPGRVHDRRVRNVGHDLLRGLDSHDVGGHVQGSKVNDLAEAVQNFGRDQNALCELFAAVQNAVAHRSDFVH